MTEEAKGEGQFVTVEAPLQIGPGQNFYDQPPFNLVLTHLALHTSLTAEQLKRLTLKIANYGKIIDIVEVMHRENGSGTTFAQLAISELRKDIYKDASDKGGLTIGGKYLSAKNAVETGKAVLADLSPYPWWFRYVGLYVPSQFRALGERIHNLAADPADSYAVWVKKQQARYGGSASPVLAGIEEVFPQQFRGRSTSLIVDSKLVRQGVTSLGVLKKGSK